jgi:pyruvate formate lyase activating enzyme
MSTLHEILDENVHEGELYEKLNRNWVRCFACAHCCKIPDGQPGVCKVRYNRGGTLYVPWGYVGGIQCDPIEKKPFFHAHPGALAYSFGMLGCDLHCAYCQNWVTSQALRDPAAAVGPTRVTSAELVHDALRQRGQVIVSTYNEPLITSEWAVAVFKEARAVGLVTGFVSNGNATPQVLEYVRPWVDLYKVDLKSFDDRHYRQLGGRLQPILDTIRRLHEMGFWLEIVTLVIPGFNDSEDELTRLAEFLASVSSDIPWHVTAFHKDYKMTDPENTRPETLMRAAEIGKKAGLRYVYAGNLPGMVGDWENTRCPNCRELLIERNGYLIKGYHLTPQGCCSSCGASIPGRWDPAFRRQITARPFIPLMRSQSDLLLLNSEKKATPSLLAALAGWAFGRCSLHEVVVHNLKYWGRDPTTGAGAQTQNSESVTPVYEVASIKLNKAGTASLKTGEGIIRQRLMFGPGTFTGENNSLHDLIRAAYRVEDYQISISGAPDWFTSELYDVNAKAGKSAVDEMQKLAKDQRDLENQRMLQALLKDRFKMTLNRETKDLPIYSLVVAEVGKLHEAQGDCGPEPPPWKPGMPPPPQPCGGLRVFNWVGRIDGQKVPIIQLVANLSGFTKRMVLDNTNLGGKYDINLSWFPGPNEFPPRPAYLPPTYQPDPNSPPLLTAIQQQLGLKLESQTAPVELLVIDHVEKPSEN